MDILEIDVQVGVDVIVLLWSKSPSHVNGILMISYPSAGIELVVLIVNVNLDLERIKLLFAEIAQTVNNAGWKVIDVEYTPEVADGLWSIIVPFWCLI